ncbi:MAG: carboxypeptidase-like regulatory domain-containing protein [Lewinella sp.]|uniref:carboxypeptidase-like regulatory domain-containing protein n=1 Tax=Lewinella sp. TaxID=2004506 RepID=UPI003D6B8F22
MAQLRFIILPLLLLSYTSWGQEGVISNATTREPLSGATIYAINNNQGTISNENGYFSLSLASFPDTLVISHLGYQQALLPLVKKETQLEIKLIKGVSILPDIVVKAYREPEKISPDHRTIMDFMIQDQKMVLLIHSDRSPHYRVQLTQLSGEIIDEKALEKTRPECLFSSCMGNTYVIYENSITELSHNSQELFIGTQSRIYEYNRFLRPCLLTDEEYTYTGYYRQQKQIFTIFASPREGEAFQLAEIYSEDLLRRLADEDRFLANKASTLQGIGNEEQRVANLLNDESIFAQQIIYQPVNAQLFTIEDDLLLFDFANHRITFFRAGDTSFRREVPFVFHQKRAFTAKILQDAVSQKLYTLTNDRNYTYVYEVNPRTGILREAAVIPEIYLKQQQIHDGTLYYLHKGITFEERWQYLYRVQVE